MSVQRNFTESNGNHLLILSCFESMQFLLGWEWAQAFVLYCPLGYRKTKHMEKFNKKYFLADFV